jgi:RND superfamily putative drug exporter
LFAAWGRFIYRFRWPALVLSVLSLAAAAFLLLGGYGGTLGAGEFSSGGTEAARGFELLDEQLPERPPSFSLIFSSPDLRATDGRFRAEVERALAPIRADRRVAAIRTPYEPAAQAQRLISRDDRRALAIVELREGEFREAVDAYRELRGKIPATSLELLPAGGLPLNEGFREATETDLRRAEFVSLPLSLLALVLVFGSLVAAGLSLGVGALAVVAAVAGTFLLARVMDVSVYATNVVTMIGLGVAIDYSLFIVSRYREELARGPGPEALARTMATAGRAVLFSGLTVAIGLAGLLFFDINDLGSMGLAGTIAVALAVLYALTFLPALLAILGPRVNALRVPFIHPDRPGGGNGFWRRLAGAVMARPWRVLLPISALLLLLGLPVLHLRLSNGDHTYLPAASESRRGTDLLLQQFPGNDANPVPVVLEYPEGDPLTPERVGTMYELSRWLGRQPHVTRVQSVVDLDARLNREQYQALLSAPRERMQPELRAAVDGTIGERIAVLTAYTPFGASSEEARALVNNLRLNHPSVGAQLLVTGRAALDVDTIRGVRADIPRAVGFIVVATYLVLFLLLGSVLLPLKAVLMNFLSLSASYGALVWIFQDGHLSGLLGFTPNPIETSTPILMFCILFGLSMDYEVLLLSRVKEEWERTGDNTHAVGLALERTGRLITGAAAIMAAVFFSFALAETVIIKAIGLGMGLAVVLDATVIRALLVPATMRLLGRWNWWAPGPLARLHARLGLAERSADAPSPESRPASAPLAERG